MNGKPPVVAAWSTPADIQSQLQRMWDDGRLLSARLNAEPLFPLELRLRQPSISALGEQFDAARGWIRKLEAGSRAAKGHGYDIVWRDVNHRQLGRNSVPEKVLVPSEVDTLRLIGREADAKRFDQLAATTLACFPQLKSWVARRALMVLDHHAAWGRILAILQWFAAHPRAGLYLRQLDIEGVDSKFIETRKALLAEMLDQVLPAESVLATATGARQFEARYGLLIKPALIRFRILDGALNMSGLSDISVPVAQFAQLDLDVRRIFITENEINGLALPNAPSSIVVFGGGYGIDRLAEIAWLRNKEIVYWGDIDTHGFAILDRLRASLPHARSMLMDADTLHAHRLLWGAEEKDKRFMGQLNRLSSAEYALFEALRDDVLGARIRMEQERLRFGWVSEAVTKI
jgi:hypothetical protein